MSVSTWSSSRNLLPELHTFNLSLFSHFCYDSNIVVHMTFAYNCTYCGLVLPLSIVVLCLGVQRWKQQRPAGAGMSHSDFFTYNMAAMELIAVVGSVLSMYSSVSGRPETLLWAINIGVFCWNGQMLFPTLICVEQYQAVVHPVTYIRLKQTVGLRIRYISTAFIWLQCAGGLSITVMYAKHSSLNLIPACLMAFCLITLAFCSISVLRVLIRPRPGAVGQDRVQLDQSKRKAFKTIIIITAVLFFRFGGDLVPNLLNSSSERHHTIRCVAMTSANWLNLPSSLTLPLLFLQRNGIIPSCKYDAKSG